MPNDDESAAIIAAGNMPPPLLATGYSIRTSGLVVVLAFVEKIDEKFYPRGAVAMDRKGMLAMCRHVISVLDN